MYQLAGIALCFFRQSVYQFLLRSLLIALLLFSWLAHNPATAQSKVTRQDVQNYVERVYAGTSGLHALFDDRHHNVLDDLSVVPGLTWLDAFAFLIAADRVAASLERGDYARAAQDSASFVVAFELSRQSTAFATLSSAFAIAGLTYIPVGWTLDSFVASTREAAIAAQIDGYIAARSAPLDRTHELIMRGMSDDEILFTTSPRGWIAVVGESRIPLIPPYGYTREQVFGAAKAIYDARIAVSGLATDRRRIEDAFAEVLRARGSDGTATLAGSWAGIYHCSDRGDPTGRIEWTIRETDDGRLTIEENSYRNGRHEYEVYDVTLDQARDVYVGRSGNYRMEFRIQRVEHLISLDGAYIGYAPCEKLLLSPSASSFDLQPPVEQSLAGHWSGVFHCEDRGSGTGEVSWKIVYDSEKYPDLFLIHEERKRDEKFRRTKYRGRFHVELGYYKANFLGNWVFFRVDAGSNSIGGIYPKWGRMFESCREFELKRAN